MTREEATHIVDVAFCVPQAARRAGEDRTYQEDEIREAKEMAITALKAEPCENVADDEPRSVIYISDGFADGTAIYDSAECPNCGYAYEIDDKDWMEPYCPHCGQALRWEGDEE